MRVVVFGDVHGNLVALEKLFQIEREETDLFISHGDVVNYGPWTNECISFLKEMENVKLLKGNHENYFIDGVYDGKNEIAKSFFEYCYGEFDKGLITSISNYGSQLLIPDFKIQHTLHDQYIFEDTNIDNLIVDSNYIFGHSHQQFMRIKNGFKLYNTGSIGQNRALINLSCYIKMDTKRKTVELKNFVHDIDVVINQMKLDRYPQICLDYYNSKKRV